MITYREYHISRFKKISSGLLHRFEDIQSSRTHPTCLRPLALYSIICLENQHLFRLSTLTMCSFQYRFLKFLSLSLTGEYSSHLTLGLVCNSVISCAFSVMCLVFTSYVRDPWEQPAFGKINSFFRSHFIPYRHTLVPNIIWCLRVSFLYTSLFQN